MDVTEQTMAESVTQIEIDQRVYDGSTRHRRTIAFLKKNLA